MPRRFLALAALLALTLAPAPAQTTAAESTAAYYVNRNAQPGGDHEVHMASCSYLPAPKNRVYLGDFRSCEAALREARKHYAQADGCHYCAPDCDTG